MALDFFGVTLSGRIIQAVPRGKAGQEKTIHLWLNPNQSSQNISNLGALAFVSQINVIYKLGSNAQLSLVLTPPFEEGLKFINSDIVHFGTGRLELEFGYTTGTVSDGASQQVTLPFSGFLQKPDVKIGNDVTITLHAMGIGYALNVTSGEEARSFAENASFATAVKQTLEKYVSIGSSKGTFDTKGLYKFFESKGANGKPLKDPKVGHLFFREPPVLPGTEPPATKKDETTGKKKKKKAKKPPVVPKLKIQVGPRNDWWFVKESVKKFGLNLFILGREIFIADSARWLKDKQAADGGGSKHFLLHGEVDPGRSMFPILTFASPTTAVWLNPGMGKWVMEDVDREKKKTKTTVSKDNVPFAIVGGDSVRDPDAVTHTNKEPQTAAANMPGDPANQAIVEQAKGEWKKMQMQGGIMVNITTLGIPSLAPGEVVYLHGFQERGGAKSDEENIFNGAYGVTEVRHNVGIGGFQTRFTAISNLFPKVFIDAASNPGQSEPQKNKPIPETDHKIIRSPAGADKRPKEC